MKTIERDIKKAVVYQIYVKSFCDSNGDGIGDIPGIISKLDYLENLGVDYLWLTPIYPSPQRDNGYDVSDYCAIDPAYGTMADFDELVELARERGMGIMLDMVLCHTSSEHTWFQQALAGTEKYRRYYILRDGRGSAGSDDPGEPPTNWQCAFGGSAWEWEPRLGKWYLHLHDVSQPDLDWTNPEVRAEAARVVRFWKSRGVMGFRFDVVNLMSKPEKFEDDTKGLGRRLFADGPHIHEYLRELVEQAGIDGMITVGEMASTDLENCIRYTRTEDHELSMSFSFHHLKVDYKNGKKWELMEPDIAELRRIFCTWQEGMQAGGGWNALFWDNHDQPRAITRFGGRDGAGDQGTDWDHVGKMLAICIHLMQGTPYVYQGDELGMTNPGFAMWRASTPTAPSLARAARPLARSGASTQATWQAGARRMRPSLFLTSDRATTAARRCSGPRTIKPASARARLGSRCPRTACLSTRAPRWPLRAPCSSSTRSSLACANGAGSSAREQFAFWMRAKRRPRSLRTSAFLPIMETCNRSQVPRAGAARPRPVLSSPSA